MTRRKSVCLKWTLVLLVVVFCPSVYTRPQEISITTVNSDLSEKSTEAPISSTQKKIETSQPEPPSSPPAENSSRDVKSKVPIKESIEMVAIQLLDKPSTAAESSIVSDIRIPPKLKTQVRHRIKTRNEDGEETENAHAGVAVPITMDELDTENKISEVTNESSTSNEGISTWISLSNSINTTTDATKVEETSKKPKPAVTKNKPKRPQNNKISKRPIIGSTNKADLVAGGSAINENVYNKIKDTVLTTVQKNKNTIRSSTTSTTTTTTTTTTEEPTTKKEPATIPVVTITSKPKKKNKNKVKTSTTEAPVVISDSALLPTEAREQEIELEVSTPAVTTKKPKRSSTKKKNKTKKRKTSTPKPSTEVAVAEVKVSNKTKSNKHAKKPAAAETGAITSQIYNYLSREVMPSVGVGMLGLASLVGIAGYFLYPFATPVRRTFEVDKNDDIYRNNAEEYANDGNGQAEEEMLGTVLAGMPAHAKQKLNPYAGQTAHMTRPVYPVKKEQDIRYRHTPTAYNPNPNYKIHYAQQKTGIAHAAVYKPVNYNPQYETRHVYTTEGKYNYDKSQLPNYTPYPAVEPIYAAPQTGPSAISSGVSSYGSDSSNSVVYGVKPTSETDFKPVYPYEGQFFSETTSSSVTYSPTSMYLGSNNEEEHQDDIKYEEDSRDGSNVSSETGDNKFVVGNVPKELVESATPAVVPEHGPRQLRKRRSISDSLEELLAEKESNKEIFISNEIDDIYANPIRNLAPNDPYDVTVLPKEITTMFSVALSEKDANPTSTAKIEVVESVSTVPLDNSNDEKTTEAPIETTTKKFKVYEVFPSNTEVTERNSPLNSPSTTIKSIMTETTTELKSETTSDMPSSDVSTVRPAKPTDDPDIITYPPTNQQSGGFLTFLQRLVDFKFRLGLGILQTTVDALNRLRDDTMEKVASASRTGNKGNKKNL